LALISLYTFSKVTPVRPPPRPRPSLRDTFAILRRNKAFAGYQTWVFLMGAGNIMAATLYPLVIVDKLHAGYGPFGVLTVITALGYLISFFVWGRVIDRKGPVFTMMLVGSCIVTMPIGMLLAPSVYWLVPFMFINGIANAGFEIGPFSAVMHYSLSTPRDVPLYMALHSILAGIRGLIFPFVATLVLAGHHYSQAISVALCISAAGTFMLWRLTRRLAAESAQSDHQNIDNLGSTTVG
jgi:MFS family permease